MVQVVETEEEAAETVGELAEKEVEVPGSVEGVAEKAEDVVDSERLEVAVTADLVAETI